MKNGDCDGPDPPTGPDDGPKANSEIGYGRPPKHSRFKPGQSGNPKGRPRGAKSRRKIVDEIANEMHWVVDSGQRVRRSTLELVLLSLRNRALEGNVKAFRAIHELLRKYEPHEPGETIGYSIFPEKLTLEEWVEAAARWVAKDAQRRTAKSDPSS
jgi:hypothetical protein